MPRPAVPSPRLLRRSSHPAFLPSDHRSGATALCHSLLIHLPSLIRLTLSMARSTSSCHAAFASSRTRCSPSIFIPLRLHPLPEAPLLLNPDPAAPRAAEALLRGPHQSATPSASVHSGHPQPAQRQAQLAGWLSLPPAGSLRLRHHFSSTLPCRLDCQLVPFTWISFSQIAQLIWHARKRATGFWFILGTSGGVICCDAPLRWGRGASLSAVYRPVRSEEGLIAQRQCRRGDYTMGELEEGRLPGREGASPAPCGSHRTERGFVDPSEPGQVRVLTASAVSG